MPSGLWAEHQPSEGRARALLVLAGAVAANEPVQHGAPVLDLRAVPPLWRYDL